MPLYIGDYLGDTQRLTTEQHGAYLLLIIDYWRNGSPPDDDAVLRQIVRLESAQWRKHRPILEKLFQVGDGIWYHKRIEHEIVAARTNQDRRSSKAQTAANARWSNAPSNAPGIPQAVHGECAPPSPSPPVKAKASTGRRASALPNDFVPALTAKAQVIADRHPDGWIDAECEQFKDDAIAKGKTFKDWQAAFRTWITNSDKWERQRNGRNGTANGRGGRPDGFMGAIIDAERADRA